MTHIELASLADDSSLDERHHEVTDWRCDPPVLHGPRVVLREVEVSDAKALMGVLGSAEVSRFISAPPSTSDGVAQFITWARRQRAAGRYIAFAVVPRGADSPVGIFHVRALETGFRAADWGFALTSELWGTGIFREAAELVLDFVFDVVGTDRVEGRVARCNPRGNGALSKLGAEREGVLRRSLHRDGEALDAVVWAILRDEWMARRRLDTMWTCRGVH